MYERGQCTKYTADSYWFKFSSKKENDSILENTADSYWFKFSSKKLNSSLQEKMRTQRGWRQVCVQVEAHTLKYKYKDEYNNDKHRNTNT